MLDVFLLRLVPELKSFPDVLFQAYSTLQGEREVEEGKVKVSSKEVSKRVGVRTRYKKVEKGDEEVRDYQSIKFQVLSDNCRANIF